MNDPLTLQILVVDNVVVGGGGGCGDHDGVDVDVDVDVDVVCVVKVLLRGLVAASNMVAPGVAEYFLVFVAAGGGAVAAAVVVSMVWVQ